MSSSSNHQLTHTLAFLSEILNTSTHNSNDLISNILSILQNSLDDNDDDDKPDKLKHLLANSATHLNQLPEQQLNQLILSLLHLHREDIQPIKQQPTCSSQKFSIRTKSRFQPRSPHPASTPSTPPFSARVAFPTATPPPEKLNASAIEFKPILSRTHSMPFQSTPINLIPPQNHHHSAHLSPTSHPFLIETTRSPTTGYTHHSPIGSPSPNSPYFNRHQQSRPTTPEIPRDPWLKDENSLLQPQQDSPAISPRLHIDQQIEFNHSDSHTLFLPFQAAVTIPLKSPLPTISTNSPGLSLSNNEAPAPQWGLSPEMAEEMAQFNVWEHSDSDGSQPPTIVHHPPEEEDGTGRYWMTPYDELCAALAGTGVSEALIDEALGQTGFDTAKAIDWLLERHGIPYPAHPTMLSIDHPHQAPSSRDPSPTRRPVSPAHSNSSSPRFTHNKSPSPTFQRRIAKINPASSSSVEESDPNPSQRVCRFYLQGCCLRSDCKFSHDVGKAVCRFWLKGHCLKGESKCDFLHEIPEIMSDETSVTVVEKAPVVRSFTDEFPSLEESRGLKKKPQARLRAAQLLPDNSAEPSPSLAKLTDTYRAKTLEFSSRRKECFDLAKESFKRADGAGVKKWSKEGDEWNRRLADETRAIAGSMIAERNRLLKDAVREGVSERLSKVEEGPDRMHRGKEMGGGICLGVVASSRNQGVVAVKERMEVLMDLHGLNPEDGVYYMEKFLMALKTEGFQGLAYVLTSASSSSSLVEDTVGGAHSSEEDAPPPSLSLSLSSSSSELTRDQAKLEKAVQNWLDRKRFAYLFFAAGPTRPAFLCIDPVRVG